jgi:TetR/AcrR family transcriptional repressor of nem operon
MGYELKGHIDMTDTRDHLLEATKELLWERGYEATSPRAILERSGAGQGSLYHHFSSKANLAAIALQEVSDEMHGRHYLILHNDKPPLERIRDYLTMPRDELRGCRMGKMTQEQIMLQTNLRDPVAAYFTFVEQEIEAALVQAQQEGSVSESINTTDLAATFAAIVQGAYVLARAFQDPSHMHRTIHGGLTLLESIERK